MKKVLGCSILILALTTCQGMAQGYGGYYPGSHYYQGREDYQAYRNGFHPGYHWNGRPGSWQEHQYNNGIRYQDRLVRDLCRTRGIGC